MDKKATSILIVEDVKTVREMLEITLKFKGYDVHVACDGADALMKLGQIKPAIIITDILMPNMDGFALVHQIRRLPRLRDVPVVFLSATYTNLEDFDFAEKIGADRYLKKPYDVDDLLLCVDEILNRDRSQAEPMQDSEFKTRHIERLQQKVAHKAELISRMRRLLNTLSPEQQIQFGAILNQEIEERDAVNAELAAAQQALQG